MSAVLPSKVNDVSPLYLASLRWVSIRWLTARRNPHQKGMRALRLITCEQFDPCSGCCILLVPTSRETQWIPMGTVSDALLLPSQAA